MPDARPIILQIMPAPVGMKVAYYPMNRMVLDAVGLALVIAIFRTRQTVDTADISLLKG